MKRLAPIACVALIALSLSPISGQVKAQTDDGGSVAVQPADTLLGLSLFYGVLPGELAQMNDLTSAPIGAGESLSVPAVGLPGIGGPIEPDAAAPDELPTRAEPEIVAKPGYYTIQPGDTLFRIATRFGVSMQTLVYINDIASQDTIYVGQTLTLPNGSEVVPDKPSQPEAPTRTAPETPSNPGHYTIQPGDTLFSIATRFGVSQDALAYVNDLPSIDTIYVGQTLTLPDGTEVIPDKPSQPETPPLTGTGGPDSVWMGEGKHIVVVLSEQTTYAYENGNLLGQFLSSTGLPGTPTVTGDYAIYLKLDSQRMVGPDYDLPGVPWVMYFYQGYGLHGTYWHNNFGHPMSHGCVNLRTGDAAWLYSWAPIGTPVHVVW